MFEEWRPRIVKKKQQVRQSSQAGRTPPPVGNLKLNSDVAVFKDGSMGFGFVIRNSSGDVSISGSSWRRGAGSSTLGEALALRFALRASLDFGFRRFLVEIERKM